MPTLLLLLGCGEPISNQVFEEDDLFLSALSDVQRVGAPQQILDAAIGDDATLDASVQAARELADFTSVVSATTDALRAATPSERTDVLRSWEAVSAVGIIDGEPYSWWVTAEIVQPEDGDLSWTVKIAAEERGAYIEVASGRHDPLGYGDLSWDLGRSAEFVDVEVSEEVADLEVDYDDFGSDDGDRAAEVRHVASGLVLQTWAMASDLALAWEGELGVTDDDLSWPATVTVAHEPGGGWALGTVAHPDGVVAFEGCWGPGGNTIYRSGDAPIVSVGRDEDCPTGNRLD